MTAESPAVEGERGVIRVFLLDDHEIVRRGLIDLLNSNSDIEVVGEASSAAEALAAVEACRPDVAVLDVRLGDGSGIEVCREIRSEYPEVACLMLTSFADDHAAIDAAMAGAAGYVLKKVAGNDLVESSPKTRTRPPVGRMSPNRHRIVVVLPDPFGPRKPWTVPGSPSVMARWETATTSSAWPRRE
jgi:CheY-like chemotaxis protein